MCFVGAVTQTFNSTILAAKSIAVIIYTHQLFVIFISFQTFSLSVSFDVLVVPMTLSRCKKQLFNKVK